MFKKKKQKTISIDCPDDYVRRRDVMAYIIGRYNDQLGFLTPKEMVEQIEMIKGMDGKRMFNPGDWVWGIDEYLGEQYLDYAVVIAVSDNFYICVDQASKEDELKDEENIAESIYEQYKSYGSFDSNVLMLRKENTFATGKEAREALGVMG